MENRKAIEKAKETACFLRRWTKWTTSSKRGEKKEKTQLSKVRDRQGTSLQTLRTSKG